MRMYVMMLCRETRKSRIRNFVQCMVLLSSRFIEKYQQNVCYFAELDWYISSLLFI